MKRKTIASLHRNGEIRMAQILMIPSDEKDWLLFFEETHGRSYFLMADDDEICHFATVDAAIHTLHELGFRHAEIRF